MQCNKQGIKSTIFYGIRLHSIFKKKKTTFAERCRMVNHFFKPKNSLLSKIWREVSEGEFNIHLMLFTLTKIQKWKKMLRILMKGCENRDLSIPFWYFLTKYVCRTSKNVLLVNIEVKKHAPKLASNTRSSYKSVPHIWSF